MEQPTTSPPARPAAPVALDDRIRSLDLLRGFALMGILMINMWAYALPFPAALNPCLVGFGGLADRIVYLVVTMTVWAKTMPIFSMLFGAGILLFVERLEARGRAARGFFYGRQLWLLLIGLVHAYLLWDGDILVPYACSGMLLYLFRRRRARTLLICAIIAMLLPKLGMQAGAVFMERAREAGRESELMAAAGDTLSAERLEVMETYHQMRQVWNPTAEEVAEDVATMRGPYPDFLAAHAPEVAMMHLVFYPFGEGWQVAGLMLLGMALFRWGVLQGRRSKAFYARMALICYALGLPLSLGAVGLLDRYHDDFPKAMSLGMMLMDVGGPLVALGHVALVVQAWKRGWLTGLQARVRAMGRMAFSNYLSHTLINVMLFNGIGLGLFGALDRLQLMGVWLAIILLQLWVSPWWLSRHRYGPAEWLWRSLTYRRRMTLTIEE